MKNFNELEKICEKYGAVFKTNAPLAPYTTFKIGGACDFLIKVNSRELLQEIVRSEIPFHILGNGSNVLVSDEGFRGVVLLLGEEFSYITADGNDGVVTCGAGASLVALCLEARDNALSGLEFAYGIPGTVGGAVYMNAGAYDGEMSHVVHECMYIDENGEIKYLNCLGNQEFGYRKSPFTATGKIILGVLMVLDFGDKAQITAKMEDFMGRRREKQPLEFPSAGSTFKRPEGDYASRLIDVCGLKGLSVGGAQVSEKHAGFIINRGGATCKDVLDLIELVKERVFKETGIILEREVEIWK